ncbi:MULTISPECIES: glutathione S-transferase family protein [unclassified Variovorax]|uniref:glutathione S-transferase family protein n=1 Tax=unclassified Variovorax TaxID=663243 RepID=UPI001BD4A457|nr:MULTISPECIES: glutathione S-transferase family protein [unclassified Variovorax]
MIVLHHCMSARSFRPLWTLEELGVPYELRMLPFPPRVFAKEYLALNPLGTIPLLEDGATRMTESAAICQYLSVRCDPDNRTGMQVRPDEPAYGAWLNWLHHGEATLTFPQTIVLRYRYFESPERKLPQAAEDYAKWFLSRLRGIEAALEGNEWLCAGRFTAADVSVGYALLLGNQIHLAKQFPPNVAAYWERLQQREGYKRAMVAQQEAAVAQGVATNASAALQD